MANSARKLLIESFGTDGEIVSWDASANFTAVGTGTSGQALTSNGTTAAPSFQDIGARVLISSASASSSASITFTSGIDSTYDHYILHFTDVFPGTTNTYLWFRTSTDGGSTYDNGASDYIYGIRHFISNGSPTDSESTGDTKITISPQNSTSGGDNVYAGDIHLFNPSGTTNDTNILLEMGGSRGSSQGYVGTGRRNAAADVDAVQFIMSSGNIASGDFYLYGIKKS